MFRYRIVLNTSDIILIMFVVHKLRTELDVEHQDLRNTCYFIKTFHGQKKVQLVSNILNSIINILITVY